MKLPRVLVVLLWCLAWAASVLVVSDVIAATKVVYACSEDDAGALVSVGGSVYLCDRYGPHLPPRWWLYQSDRER